MTVTARPVLKIVERSTRTSTEAQGQAATRRVQHDDRGNAVWSVPVDLADAGDLMLQADASATADNDGDPYNRGPIKARPMR